jgi:2-aminoethylphosphonate-pyruvate transaminase
VPNYVRAQANGTVPFTPPIPARYGLDAALDELADRGPGRRKALYQARMAYLDREFARLELVPLVAPEHRSRSVRSLPLPAGLCYGRPHEAVKAAGYVIYAGIGDAAGTTFRFCPLGNLEVAALEGFVACLERLLDETRSNAGVA